MRVIVAQGNKVIIEINSAEFKNLTGVDLARDHYGNGGVHWGKVTDNVYDLSSVFSNINSIKNALALKDKMEKSLDEIKEEFKNFVFPIKPLEK